MPTWHYLDESGGQQGPFTLAQMQVYSPPARILSFCCTPL